MSVVSQGIVADVRAMRQALLQRFVVVGATSPDRTLALLPEALTPDELSLFEDFVERGLIVECRGEHYLDQDALEQETSSTPWRMILGILALVGAVGAMVWFAGDFR
jgi:hypothetical protein